jgi:hypothetical protein
MRNQPDSRKHHVIYKTTRQDGSGKYYIGMHSTDTLDDRYLGSGVILNRSIKKYGRALHKKKILEHLPSREALAAREAALVNEKVLNDPLCMNMTHGGGGGGLGEKNPFFGKTHSTETKDRLSAQRRGKQIGEDTKRKISEKLVGRVLPEMTAATKDKLVSAWRTRRLNPVSSKTKELMSKAHSGKNHHFAKVYSVTSPLGEVTETDDLKAFCRENFLPYSTMSGCSKDQVVPKAGKCAGWKICVLTEEKPTTSQP